jgi:hypothetical protein
VVRADGLRNGPGVGGGNAEPAERYQEQRYRGLVVRHQSSRDDAAGDAQADGEEGLAHPQFIEPACNESINSPKVKMPYSRMTCIFFSHSPKRHSPSRVRRTPLDWRCAARSGRCERSGTSERGRLLHRAERMQNLTRTRVTAKLGILLAL